MPDNPHIFIDGELIGTAENVTFTELRKMKPENKEEKLPKKLRNGW